MKILSITEFSKRIMGYGTRLEFCREQFLFAIDTSNRKIRTFTWNFIGGGVNKRITWSECIGTRFQDLYLFYSRKDRSSLPYGSRMPFVRERLKRGHGR